jgi:hypothetical protein
MRDTVRRLPDFGRMAEGVGRPGIDPRSWISLARVDDDPDAIVWRRDLGWVVDVTLVGGSLDGEGPIPCRVATPAAGQGITDQDPPRFDGLVVVAIAGGDVNIMAVIIGQLHDVTRQPPRTVNDVEITEDLAKVTRIQAYPGEDLEAEYRAVRMTSSEEMILGSPTADQHFVRGEDYADAEASFLDALSAFCDEAVTPVGPFGGVGAVPFAAATVKLKAAVELFKAKRSDFLSTKIRGT